METLLYLSLLGTSGQWAANGPRTPQSHGMQLIGGGKKRQFADADSLNDFR